MRSSVLSVLAGMVVLGLVCVTPPAAAIDAAEMFDDPAKELRAREISRNLRCLVCQNQSIFDSNATLAKDLRVLVRERIEAGDTDGEAVDFIVARYGDYVLLEPPVKPATYALWAAPFVLLLVGFLLVRAFLRRPSDAVAPKPLDAEERAAARRLLEGGGT